MLAKSKDSNNVEEYNLTFLVVQYYNDYASNRICIVDSIRHTLPFYAVLSQKPDSAIVLQISYYYFLIVVCILPLYKLLSSCCCYYYCYIIAILLSLVEIVVEK